MTARNAFRSWESYGGQSAALGAKQFSRLAISAIFAGATEFGAGRL